MVSAALGSLIKGFFLTFSFLIEHLNAWKHALTGASNNNTSRNSTVTGYSKRQNR